MIPDAEYELGGGNVLLNVRDVFSANLRALCEDVRSTSHLCRELNINRQQFARYLNGASLPGQTNLEKICRYFGIDEIDLFQPGERGEAVRLSRMGNGVRAEVMDILEEQTHARLPEGAYWVDYASPQFPNSIVRAVQLVKHREACTGFLRLTGIAERPDNWWSRYRGYHKGIVMERHGVFFFNGMNTIGIKEASLLVVRPAPGHRFILTGTATVMGTSGPTVMAVAISEAPRAMPLLSVIRKARSFDVDQPEIPSHILDLLTAESEQIQKPAAAFLGGQAVN